MRGKPHALMACVLGTVLPALLGAEISISDRFYDAIRRDDAAAVQTLLQSGANVNVKDSRGGTPLMYAASVGSEAMMRKLIAAGADINAKNSFGATALIFAADSMPLTKLLVEHGADVNVRSTKGHTPIEVAAGQAGGLEIVKLLLAKGATLALPPDAQGNTPLSLASAVNETATMKFLIERNAKEAIAGPGGAMALMNAAMFQNTEMVKLLLAKGVDVNSVSPDETEHVKNGPIAIGRLTALILAVGGGTTETVQTLLEAGANVNARDVRGMTPLMLAVATDHPNVEVVRMLLAHGADTMVKSKAGETVMDWALKFRNPAVLAALGAPAVRTASAEAHRSEERGEGPEPRAAVEKAVALMQASGTTMFREGGCVSCHGGNIVTESAAAARRSGVRIDEAAAKEMARATRLQFAARADGYLERQDPAAVEILTNALAALADEDTPADRTIDAMIHNIGAQQLASGWWPYGGILRPPTADSPVSTAALAIRVMQRYAPPARKQEYAARVARAARAIQAAEPWTTEDAVAQTLGLKWAGLDASKAAARVARLQREDGGWAQTQFLESDAYATATALDALFQTGTAADAGAYRRGVAFLLRTQAADGSWHVASRAPKFQPYFDGGFPYGHDEWISQWSTGLAAIAISHTLPGMRAAR